MSFIRLRSSLPDVSVTQVNTRSQIVVTIAALRDVFHKERLRMYNIYCTWKSIGIVPYYRPIS